MECHGPFKQLIGGGGRGSLMDYPKKKKRIPSLNEFEKNMSFRTLTPLGKASAFQTLVSSFMHTTLLWLCTCSQRHHMEAHGLPKAL